MRQVLIVLVVLGLAFVAITAAKDLQGQTKCDYCDLVSGFLNTTIELFPDISYEKASSFAVATCQTYSGGVGCRMPESN